MSGPAHVAPGSHGGDAEHLARHLGVPVETLVDLSASLNPVAPDVARLAADHLGALRRYPDARAARAMLAEVLSVEPEQLLVTNGGAEAIALLGHQIGGRVDEPEFSLHPRQSRPGLPAPRWRSDPHNPTGRLAPADEVAEVWDEAFYPLATGRWSDVERPAVAVVGSLTKVFACPGLRLGYVLADPELIAGLAAHQAEWSVGGLALALLPELLARADLVRWRDEVAALRADLAGVLVAHGLAPWPSDANFVLCDAPPGLRAALLEHGVVVRDCASFGLPGQVRIAVPGPAGLERLDRALDALGLDHEPTTLSPIEHPEQAP